MSGTASPRLLQVGKVDTRGGQQSVRATLTAAAKYEGRRWDYYLQDDIDSLVSERASLAYVAPAQRAFTCLIISSKIVTNRTEQKCASVISCAYPRAAHNTDSHIITQAT